jgi:hypothetical protein
MTKNYSQVKYIFFTHWVSNVPNPLPSKYMPRENGTLLANAVDDDNVDTVTMFFNNGLTSMVCWEENYDEQVAYTAYNKGSRRVFELFLQKKYDPNYGCPCSGSTLLTLAVAKMDELMVWRMLKIGVTFQCKNSKKLDEVLISKAGGWKGQLYRLSINQSTPANAREIRKWICDRGFEQIFDHIYPRWREYLFGTTRK